MLQNVELTLVQSQNDQLSANVYGFVLVYTDAGERGAERLLLDDGAPNIVLPSFGLE